MKSLPKVKLGHYLPKVKLGDYLPPIWGLSTLIGHTIYHFNSYLALFIYIFQYLAFITIFTNI